MKFLKSLFASGALMLSSATIAPASFADVIYRFEATELTGLSSVVGEAKFTDAAFAAGVSNPAFRLGEHDDKDGMVYFFLSVASIASGSISQLVTNPFDIYQFFAYFELGPTLTGIFGLVTGDPGTVSAYVDAGVTSGSASDFYFSLDDEFCIPGTPFGTECRATGVWHLVIPEPATLALLAAPLLPLALMRRRRQPVSAGLQGWGADSTLPQRFCKLRRGQGRGIMKLKSAVIALAVMLGCVASAASIQAKTLVFTPFPEEPFNFGFWGKITYDEWLFKPFALLPFEPPFGLERAQLIAPLQYVGLAFDRPNPLFGSSNSPDGLPNIARGEVFDVGPYFSFDGAYMFVANDDGTRQLTLEIGGSIAYFQYDTDAGGGPICTRDAYTCTGRAFVTEIPEPASLAILAVSLLSLGIARRRRLSA